MSGLGERGSQLRRVARRLDPPPAVPPFYVQLPDDECRAPGWYMREIRDGEPVYLGHSASVAEVFLLRIMDTKPRKRVKRKARARSTA